MNFNFLELKSGRCPNDLKRMNVWSAEEWQKFTFPIAESLFWGMIHEDDYHIVWLTFRITQLLFNNRDGLSEKLLETSKKICLRRAILLEENIDQKECVITCHETMHIVADILRFGHSDNFWCFSFERAVKK